MRVGVVTRGGSDRATALADRLRRRLTAESVSVVLDPGTVAALSGESADGTGVGAEDAGADDGTDADVDVDAAGSLSACDLVVSIGGDGTFLAAARRAGGTPVLGVNLGEVGFLNAVGPGEAVAAVRREVAAFRDGEMRVREAPRLAARVGNWTGEPAINEVVVQGRRRGRGSGVDYEVRVDGTRYSGGHADGVLVATPTGSTAYNLGEAGPLVHPGVDGLVVNEMAADGGMPPLVVDGDSEVTVSLDGDGPAVVVGDGREGREVSPPAAVRVGRTDPPVRMAGPRSDFFEALGKLD